MCSPGQVLQNMRFQLAVFGEDYHALRNFSKIKFCQLNPDALICIFQRIIFQNVMEERFSTSRLALS